MQIDLEWIHYEALVDGDDCGEYWYADIEATAVGIEISAHEGGFRIYIVNENDGGANGPLRVGFADTQDLARAQVYAQGVAALYFRDVAEALLRNSLSPQ